MELDVIHDGEIVEDLELDDEWYRRHRMAWKQSPK
jgi:hypothetical protein